MADVTGNAADTDDDTAVLQLVIRVVHSGSDCSDVSSLAVTEHLLDPAVGNDLDIVVQEEQVLTPGILNSEIIDRGVIEDILPVNDLYVVVLCLYLLVVCKCLRLRRIILSYDYFKIPVSRFFKYRNERAVQHIPEILIGYYDRDQRLSLYLIPGTIGADILGKLAGRMDTAAVVVGLNGFPAVIVGVHLALRVSGGRCLVSSPVIEELRDMMYFSRFLDAAEDKVIILGSVEFASLVDLFLSAYLIDDGFSNTEDVSYIVVRAEKIRAEVRLEVRAVINARGIHDLIFIRVERINLRVLIKSFNDLIAGIFLDCVVVVAQHDEIA